MLLLRQREAEYEKTQSKEIKSALVGGQNKCAAAVGGGSIHTYRCVCGVTLALTSMQT